MSVKRKAVLVGIDRYQMPGANLSGCENDAEDMANTLRILGFPVTRIHTLTNEQGTKANIAKQLDWLCKDMKEGDVAVYYHSSHGTGVTDVDNDEADSIDELACTHDFNWDDEKTWLTDDTFYDYFTKRLPEGVRTDCIFDTCYSGTMTKALRPIGQTAKPMHSRYLVPPLNQRQQILRMKPTETNFKYIGDSVLGSKNEADVVTTNKITSAGHEGKPIQKFQYNSLISACQDYQESYELDMEETGQVRGAFTYNFCKILRRSNGNLTRNELFTGVRQSLFEQGINQTPDLALPDMHPEAGNLSPFRKASEADTLEEIMRIRQKKPESEELQE